MATSTAAQGRPFGIPPPADVRATLGDCPVEALRDAWDGMDALEAVAVEAEVLRLCTERADAIAGLLERQTDLDAAVAVLRGRDGRPPEPVVGDMSIPMPDPALAAMRTEAGTLRRRIADLELRDPASAALPALREALARRERQLAAAAGDSDPPATAQADAPVPDSLPEGTDSAPPAPAVPEGPAPREDPPPPAPTVSDWHVAWTARLGDGPWTAALSRTTVTWVEPPAGADGVLPPPFPSERPEGPFMVAVGGCLPDGAFVTGIGPDGADLTDPADPACDGASAPPFPPEPGPMAFDVHPVGPER